MEYLDDYGLCRGALWISSRRVAGVNIRTASLSPGSGACPET